MQKTSLNVNNSSEGERIEDKCDRILNNKEPITDGAPTIYTERKEGVQPAYNIRTDKQEIAIGVMDKISRSNTMKREEAIKERQELLDDLNKKEKGEGEA